MTRSSFCTQGAMPRDKYDVIRRGTYWFLFANCLGLLALLVVSTLAYGLVGLIDSHIPGRERVVAATPLDLWIVWWAVSLIGPLSRRQPISSVTLWRRSNAWTFALLFALALSLALAGLLVVRYR